MNKKVFVTISSSLVTLAAGAALAGTPLPDPPFTAGGFNPPSKDVLKQEQAVGGIIGKYVDARSKCDQKAIGAQQKAYEAGDVAKQTENTGKWTACVQKSNDKYTAARDKQLGKGTPSCLNHAGIGALKGQIDAQLPLLGVLVYCDGGQANPDAGTGLKIPATKDQAKAEVAVAVTAGKAGNGAGKCYTKAATTTQKNGGSLPAADLTKFTDCVNKSATKGADGITKIVAKGTLPGCLTAGTANSLVASAVALGGNFTDETYCASPSAAFLDGASTF